MENVKLPAIRSFYTNQMGLVTLDDDVLSIVRQVNELYDGKVSIQLDPVTGWYHFVGHEEDGTDRLIFTVQELDGRAFERLQAADSQWRGHEDPYDAAEREQDELQAQIDENYKEKIRESSERLAWAIKKDGIDDRLPLSLPVSRRKRAHR